MSLRTHASKNPWLLAGAVVALALVAQIPALSGDLIYDDTLLITEDARVTSAGGLWKIWFARGGTNYAPLTMSAFWLQYRLWGEAPAGYHVVTLLMHAVGAALVFLTLKRLKVPGAVVAAMVFAVHPVNVESGAWISQLKNTLAMVFFLLTILTYLKFEDNPRRRGGRMDVRGYVVSAVMFALALLSKPAVVMLPVVLLAMAWWRRSRITLKDLLRSVPFFAMSLGAGLMSMWVQAERAIGSAPIRPEGEGFFTQLAIAGMAVWFYLYKAVVPLGLSLVYPRWEVDGGAIVSYVPLVLLIGGFVALWRARKAWWAGPTLAALGYYVIVLLPMLGFLDNSYWAYSLVADRYQYFSIVAVIALVVAGAAKLLGLAGTDRRKVGVSVAVGFVGVLTVLTWHRAGLFADAVNVWEDTVEKNPRSWFARNNLGSALMRSDRPGKYEAAQPHLAEALALTKDEVLVWVNNGALLHETGRPEGAVAYYREALRLDPMCVMAHLNMGQALVAMGEYDEAIDHYGQVTQVDPQSLPAYVGLAQALREAERFDQAREYLAYALQLVPDDATVNAEMGLTVAMAGRVAEAADYFAKAVRIDRENVLARFGLGKALNELGEPGEAATHLRACIRLAPNHAPGHLQLGIALNDSGKPLTAAGHFARALELDPDSDQAADRLSSSLAGQGRYVEAEDQFIRAVMLRPENPVRRAQLARIFDAQGKAAQAAEQYSISVQLDPEVPDTLNALAWLLATCHDEKIRNGEQAVGLARRARNVAGGQDPATLDTLAAALAEIGQFDEAVKVATQAVKLAEAAISPKATPQDKELLEQYRSRLKRYKAKRPYHSTALTAPGADTPAKK